ncbi:MAG: tetratricopeptide repeat protein [Opitutales bacterium]
MSKREDYDFELSFFESLKKRMPSDVRVVSILAHLYTKTGQIDEGLKMDRKLVRLQPDDPTIHYNLACSLALKGRKADALKVLRTAITLGYKDFNWMQHDPDLVCLQNYSPYKKLLEEVSA